MAYSPLTNVYMPASTSNYTEGRSGQTIKKITWHHMAGNLSVESCGKLWQDPSRRASSNYGIGTDGRIGCYVEEQNRSWCSSSAANDNQAITIEIANDGGAPDWHVSDKAIESAINLTVDVCKRNGIKQLVWTGDANGTFTWHCMFTSTACPGPYLKGKTAWAVDQINQRLADYDKPDLTWTQLDKAETWITNLNPTHLWDFNHRTYEGCQSVKEYKPGEELVIYGKVYNKQLDATYLLTEYSFTNKITNGFNQNDMVKKVEPEPEPTPEPTPEPDPTVSILQKIIAFIQHIIDLITGKK